LSHFLPKLVICLTLFAMPAGAASLAEILPEKALGSADAPVTLYEHSSLTCSHCAAFHRETYPRLKKEYIDTGKLRLVYRDYPLGQLALVAAMLPHCAGPERYFGFLQVLYRGQDQWSRSDNPLRELETVARLAGMSKAEFDACLSDKELYRAIRERAQDDQTVYGIQGTPTFRIEGKQLSGARPFEDFQEIIEAALAAKR
jgi:protein-disulfide isomerase